MSIIQTIRQLFGPKSDLEMAVTELENAKRERLQAQSAQEYATSMVAYHGARIERLQDYIASQQESKT